MSLDKDDSVRETRRLGSRSNYSPFASGLIVNPTEIALRQDRSNQRKRERGLKIESIEVEIK